MASKLFVLKITAVVPAMTMAIDFTNNQSYFVNLSVWVVLFRLSTSWNFMFFCLCNNRRYLPQRHDEHQEPQVLYQFAFFELTKYG